MTDRASIRRTLIEVLEADTGEKHTNLAEDACLREGLGLDSVDVVSIVSQIERRFHLRLSQEELEKLATVADILNLLEAKLSPPARPGRGVATKRRAAGVSRLIAGQSAGSRRRCSPRRLAADFRASARGRSHH